MHVSTLQQLILSLLPPLRASGAKASLVDDWERAAKELEPFKDHDVEEFVALLGQASEYMRTGIIPFAVEKKVSPAKPSKTVAKPAKITLDDARQVVAKLSQEANMDLTDSRIDAELAPLDGLTKDEVVSLAQEFSKRTKLKSKKEAIEVIRDTLINFTRTDSRNAAIRSNPTLFR